MEILQRIDRLKTELDTLRPLDPEREAQIMQKFRIDWNFHSNHLEGNSLSYGETKALILFGITAQGKPLKDHLEMTGHNEAIKWIEEVVREERPLTENFIRQLHTLLLKEPYQVDAVTPDGQPTKKWVKVGEYKTTPNNVITVTGEPFYFASPEETPAKMHDLIEWYRAENEKGELHPLLLAAEFHYRFVRIHPFDDGNGRTARILMNFILMQHKLPPVIIKTEDKENYFAALRQADAGLLEPFIEYIGENLVRSLELMLKGAKGETIDEPDDVDKEIVLLEQRLKSLQHKDSKKIISKEVLLEIFENSIKPLFHHFEVESNKFKVFYNKAFIIISDGLEFHQFRYFPFFEIQNAFSKADITYFSVSYVFEMPKYATSEFFEYTSDIRINFNKYDYKIVIDEEREQLQKSYENLLTQKEIEGLIRIITKAHTAFINQKIEEVEQKSKM